LIGTWLGFSLFIVVFVLKVLVLVLVLVLVMIIFVVAIDLVVNLAIIGRHWSTSDWLFHYSRHDAGL